MKAKNTSIAVFKQAWRKRLSDDELIIHSDRGIRYVCKVFINELADQDAMQWISRKDDCPC